MSSTFKPLEEEEEPIPDLSPPKQETTYGIGFRPSPTPEKVYPSSFHKLRSTLTFTQVITRDFAHTFSVRRKPVPITPPSGILRNDTAASLTPSTAGRLEGAGQAAQDRRKKRRLSTAFSEMNFSEGKGDKDEMEVELLCKGEEDKPKRFKRIKSRLSGWFGGKKE